MKFILVVPGLQIPGPNILFSVTATHTGHMENKIPNKCYSMMTTFPDLKSEGACQSAIL